MDRDVLERIDEFTWRIPKSYKKGMRVDGVIYANEKLLEDLLKDKATEQVANVAFLPGIVKASLAMPDIHWGYGFPIGGVAATDIEAGGVISPGGVGFDINCGVRLLRSDLEVKDIKTKLELLINTMFSDIPSGVGSSGQIVLNSKDSKEILIKGARWAVEKGFGTEQDLEVTEDNGFMEGADIETVSKRALERGKFQSGTLGSGNHFLEVQVVDEIFDEKIAQTLGLFKNQVTVMIHSGSRGFGYQVCDEYARKMIRCLDKYDISVPDKQLACAPLNSAEGKSYFCAMKCAANYAWANRQCLMHLVRSCFAKVFNASWSSLGLQLIYDVAHNIAKIEKHVVDGKQKLLCVHRKGATRSFGPGQSELPLKYRSIGQPVIVPGDMGTSSYLCVGTDTAMEKTFGSSCHGAGRVKSRTQAARTINLNVLLKELQSKGIIVKAKGNKTIVEEAPSAYKDIDQVIEVVNASGIAKKIVRFKPLGVIKG
ncbi:MAG: RtcB family protein [Candidatus Gygaella obscura]|nr:RtcB family protein [Candidatus Gygaella obscura]